MRTQGRMRVLWLGYFPVTRSYREANERVEFMPGPRMRSWYSICQVRMKGARWSESDSDDRDDAKTTATKQKKMNLKGRNQIRREEKVPVTRSRSFHMQRVKSKCNDTRRNPRRKSPIRSQFIRVDFARVKSCFCIQCETAANQVIVRNDNIGKRFFARKPAMLTGARCGVLAF